MKRLKFHHSLVSQILSGKKTTTWRLFDDKDLQTGDELSLVDANEGAEFARATIICVEEKTFGDLGDSDWNGHEKFSSEEEMYQTYSNYYDTQVDENTTVKILHFTLI